MPIHTTASNDRATQRALPDGNATLLAVQQLVDAHMAAVLKRPRLDIKLLHGMAAPTAIRPIDLREALLAGEPI